MKISCKSCKKSTEVSHCGGDQLMCLSCYEINHYPELMKKFRFTKDRTGYVRVEIDYETLGFSEDLLDLDNAVETSRNVVRDDTSDSGIISVSEM